MTFVCKKCGKCCRNIDLMVPELARKDGICKHYDDDTRLCLIYERRPLVCRVEDQYEKLLKDRISKEEYYKYINYMCNTFERRK